jgi:hypothetical protein
MDLEEEAAEYLFATKKGGSPGEEERGSRVQRERDERARRERDEKERDDREREEGERRERQRRESLERDKREMAERDRWLTLNPFTHAYIHAACMQVYTDEYHLYSMSTQQSRTY